MCVPGESAWRGNTRLQTTFVLRTDHVAMRGGTVEEDYRLWETQLQVSRVHGPGVLLTKERNQWRSIDFQYLSSDSDEQSLPTIKPPHSKPDPSGPEGQEASRVGEMARFELPMV
jgi:hypothetical protein